MELTKNSIGELFTDTEGRRWKVEADCSETTHDPAYPFLCGRTAIVSSCDPLGQRATGQYAWYNKYGKPKKQAGVPLYDFSPRKTEVVKYVVVFKDGSVDGLYDTKESARHSVTDTSENILNTKMDDDVLDIGEVKYSDYLVD